MWVVALEWFSRSSSIWAKEHHALADLDFPKGPRSKREFWGKRSRTLRPSGPQAPSVSGRVSKGTKQAVRLDFLTAGILDDDDIPRPKKVKPLRHKTGWRVHVGPDDLGLEGLRYPERAREACCKRLQGQARPV